MGTRVSDMGTRASDVGTRASDVAARASNVAARASDVAARGPDAAARASDVPGCGRRARFRTELFFTIAIVLQYYRYSIGGSCLLYWYLSVAPRQYTDS